MLQQIALEESEDGQVIAIDRFTSILFRSFDVFIVSRLGVCAIGALRCARIAVDARLGL